MKRTFAAVVGIGSFLALALIDSTPAYAQAAKEKKANKKEKSAETANPAPKFRIDQAPIARSGNNSYAPIIKKTAPSVVSVFSTRTVDDSEMLRNNPGLEEFFRRYFGPQGPQPGPQERFPGPEEGLDEDPAEPPQRPRRRGNRTQPRTHQEQGLGSGVIITEDGYIVTNNHVIEGADDIKVETASGTRYKAKLVGADALSDIAVLKIEGSNLPAISIGSSDNLEVGDVVLAIGNPFNIGQTVTMGIISGVGRSLGITAYDDLIQTDAAINMGNSGGALIDAQGRLIGVNTAILSRTGGNVGVGFAVPVNMARNVVEGLILHGKVARGILGVVPQQVDPALAKEFSMPEGSTGALVADFAPRGAASPARDAGIKVGDIITEFNGAKVRDDSHLRLMVSQTAPGTDSTVKVLRDGKAQTFKVKLAEHPGNVLASNDELDPKKDAADNEALEGVAVGDLDSRTRQQFNIPRDVEGALVSEVDPDSKSYEAGLRPGHVILEIDRKTVANAEQAVKMSENVKGDSVVLRVYANGNRRFLSVENGRNEPPARQDRPAQPNRSPRR